MLSNLIELLNPDNTISAHRMLAHAIGMTETIIYSALISKQAYYARNDMLSEDGWFYSTVSDLQESTTFGVKAQRTAITHLMEFGLIECENKGLPARRYFRIVDDTSVLESLIEDGFRIAAQFVRKDKLDSAEGTIKKAPPEQTSYCPTALSSERHPLTKSKEINLNQKNPNLKSIDLSRAGAEKTDGQIDRPTNNAEPFTFAETLDVIGVDWCLLMDNEPTSERDFKDFDEDMRDISRCAIPYTLKKDKRAMKYALQYLSAYSHIFGEFPNEQRDKFYDTLFTAIAEMTVDDKVTVCGETVMYYEIIDKLNELISCSDDVKSVYMEMCATFEQFSNERFYKKSAKYLLPEEVGKEKIRLHHYVQSFVKGEVTPEAAHQLGIEWAKKVFGENHQVLVTTHVNTSHIHNHFAVAAFDLNGKAWHDNMKSLKRCRDISDKLCKEHGLSVIEKPRKKKGQQYAEWLAKRLGISWKEKICNSIDELIQREDVQNVSDLADKLRERGYIVTLGKYLSIRTGKDRQAIRSHRLGDGYGVEDLQFRIEHKDREMSFEEMAKYDGVQFEYAFCLRELQLMVYRKKENPQHVTYDELRKNTELLCYLSDNNIRSVDDFENAVNAAADKVDSLKKSAEEITVKLEEAKKDFLMGYIHKEVEKYKGKLSEKEQEISAAESEKKEIGQMYQTFLRQMQTDYDYILEKLRREREEYRRKQSISSQRRSRGNYL